MNADVSKEKSGEIPLYALGLFCFISLIFCNTRLTVSGKSPLATASDKTQTSWTVWKFKKSNVCGLFLKMAMMVSSPLTSLTSTSLLLVGIVKKNMYLFLPWLAFAFKGIFLVQSLNLVDMFESFQETEAEESGWKSYVLYFVVLAFDMAECFFLRKILHMFQELWVTGFSNNEEEVVEREIENVDEKLNSDTEN